MQDLDTLYRGYSFHELANDLEPLPPRRPAPPGNSVFLIRPVRSPLGVWTFTDPAAGLVDEPFVGAINDMIDHLVAGIKGARRGFNLYFSALPLPGAQLTFTLVQPEADTPAQFRDQYETQTGATYRCLELGLEGWLCPALFCYFAAPPPRLYARAEKARK